MNLSKIQELEDLKAKLSGKGKQYNKMFATKKKNYLSQAVIDFENFFKEKNFSVSKSNNMIKAQYNTMEISIKCYKTLQY